MQTDYIDHEVLEHVLSCLMPQNELILRICISTGLRIGDVLNLRTEDLNKQRIYVHEAKTGKSRRIYLSSDLKDRCIKQAGKIYVFQHRTDANKHKTRQAVYLDLKRSAKAFRIKNINVSVHSMRKVYAVAKYKKSGDIQVIRHLLNHDSIEVTYLYALADIITANKYK